MCHCVSADLLSPSCQPAANLRCCIYSISKPQLVQLCVQLGCQPPHNIKTNMTTCQAHAARTQNQTYVVVFPAVERTEEKTDIFSLVQLQKPSGLTSETLRNIWISRVCEYDFSTVFLLASIIFRYLGPKYKCRQISNLQVYYVVVGKIFFLCQHNFISYHTATFSSSKECSGDLIIL